MCKDCGCSGSPAHAHGPGHHHDHQHDHDHGHHHDHAPAPASAPAGRTVEVRQSVLSENDRLAERNRGYFAARGMLVLNVVSSPGSGKTALLERTLTDLHARVPMAVIVGDLATDNDAQRLRRSGAPAVQITTGTACHLDAHQVRHGLEDLAPAQPEILFIENVGNLVCPASFDLGEDLRVVVIAVTEGEDKPLKYPVIFHNADAVLVNKIDLAAAVDFPRDLALANLRQAAPRAAIFEVSARTGAGLEAWYDWLLHERAHKRGLPH
jgi:hydrogenase nickel incorporation protein HypB